MRSLSAALAALLLAAPLAAEFDPSEQGVRSFLGGKLDSAIAYFDQALQANPQDSRAKEMLGHCLAIKGKDSVREGKFAQGRAALGRAQEIFPSDRDLKLIAVMAEMEESAPTPEVPISTAALDTTADNAAMFDCVFGNGECARGGRYLVHIVQKGETMAEIAIKYYNDFTLWEKIWKANPQLPNPHRLEKGTRLLIPLP